MEEIVEILLPTYNGEEYIEEQIDSILNQTYKNIKVIISDDCSKDSTQKILKEYKEKDNRIQVFFQQNNLGVVKNIEFLLKKVNSKIFMLSDQDDYWMPEKVEESVKVLNQNNSDIVFGDLEVVDEKLNMIYPSFNDYMLLTRKINKYLNTNKLNYLYNCFTGCTICAKSDLIGKILPLPEISKFVIHDYWIGLMASLNGKVEYIPEKYIKYRQHGNNQVGTEKISHGFSKFEQVRDWFIEVKLGVFETYVENNSKFPDDLQLLNKNALDYYKMLKNIKICNFKGWNIFHKLYKTETFLYYIENFLILNIPIFSKLLFYIRLKILKLLRKRKES